MDHSHSPHGAAVSSAPARLCMSHGHPPHGAAVSSASAQLLCHAARTSDLFGHHEISVVVVRGDYSIYCISQQSLTRFCRHLPKPIFHWLLKKGQGLHNLWGSTVAKTVREKLNCLHADEQHRCRMDLFVLLQEDNLPANDKIMMR